jgi:hypothetical protein
MNWILEIVLVNSRWGNLWDRSGMLVDQKWKVCGFELEQKWNRFVESRWTHNKMSKP